MLRNIATIKEVPSKRMFTLAEAARYTGKSKTIIIELTDIGVLQAYMFRGRREYRLEDLDRLIESQPKWEPQQLRRKGVPVSKNEE